MIMLLLNRLVSCVKFCLCGKKSMSINWRGRFIEGNLRSLAKVASWRVLVTVTNFGGGWISSGSWRVGVGVASFALVVNSILYFVHERVWNEVGWEKKERVALGS
jgi:uncharacterized membrane protein